MGTRNTNVFFRRYMVYDFNPIFYPKGALFMLYYMGLGLGVALAVSIAAIDPGSRLPGDGLHQR